MCGGSPGHWEVAEAAAHSRQVKGDLDVTRGGDEGLRCPGMEQGC